MVQISKKQNNINFLITYILSAFGYEFIFFIMTVHIYDITKSAINVSIFAVLTYLPRFFSPACGVIADRFGRLKVLRIAALATSVMLLFLSLVNNISEVYVLWFIISIMLTFIINVRGTLIAEIVPAEKYHTGNSVVLILLNAAKLLAPFLGGLVALKFQINVLLYATCIIYIAAVVMSSFIKSEKINVNTEKTNPMKKIPNGFKFIKENNYLKYLTYVGFAWRLFLGMQVSIFIIYVKTYLGGNDSQYGLFMTLIGLGSIAGSFVGPWLAKIHKNNRIIILGLLIHFASFAALGLIKSYYIACLVVILSFAVFYATLVSIHALRDQSTQSSIRGSVYGSVTGLLSPAGICSMLIGGFLAEKMGVELVLTFAGFSAVITLLLITFLLSPFNQDVKSGTYSDGVMK